MERMRGLPAPHGACCTAIRTQRGPLVLPWRLDASCPNKYTLVRQVYSPRSERFAGFALLERLGDAAAAKMSGLRGAGFGSAESRLTRHSQVGLPRCPRNAV
jgi:hypothetical protein